MAVLQVVSRRLPGKAQNVEWSLTFAACGCNVLEALVKVNTLGNFRERPVANLQSCHLIKRLLSRRGWSLDTGAGEAMLYDILTSI
jgi:hypothetical protein